MPVESTIMVAIPELDGATGPIVFGGRSRETATGPKEMRPHTERVNMLAARVDKLITLRKSARRDRKVGVVLFNFPPNAGNTGTAAFLAVFESLFNLLTRMQSEGYTVTVPASVDELREIIVNGNRERFGAHANVHTRIPAQDHIRRELYLKDIETQWGAAPGRQQSDGSSIFVLGERFGNVFVGLQPSMGYEGDPMRLSRKALRRRMPSRPSTAGCARILAPTRCCISEPMARWNSCLANRRACRARAGQTG